MASSTTKALAAIMLFTASGAATAQDSRALGAAPHSVAQRAGESVEGENSLNGTMEWVLVALSLGLIIFGIIEFSSDQNNSNSP